MEVAESQWRREWAGTAEYGKVHRDLIVELVASVIKKLAEAHVQRLLHHVNVEAIQLLDHTDIVVEGGVTRRVARAMEVLHASGPGAKVRVMRAAYHTSAGPGLPASSYMMHASRRVFSSGFNFLEQPPSLPTKPLEISSTPYESTPDLHVDTDIENYKVTEPDDFEISEPSKWKSSKGGNMRMPSEESSSTDNGSIIDLDPRTNHRNILRKYSYDSENSDITHSGRNRVSPLLDAPVTLSTLKFKSLLNGSNDWNSRRKSYSFENTSPLSDTMLHNDTLAMESSTDSGICKSTEIVNDHDDDNAHLRYYDSKEREISKQGDDSFQSWLSKNRQNNYYFKGPKFKSYREHEVVAEDPAENNIMMQSTGTVSITLPIKVETDDGYHYQKNYISEDGQRKMKKVEFCKTELHFAVDTGKVNIIATDEKPPPTNDFRKRRSAFVPLHEMIEKPITLLGEKVNDFSDINQRNEDSLKHAISEFHESDENTAATKSILKNKIPKPKPYLLGENMAFGSENILKNDSVKNSASHVLTAVSLMNRQLQSEKRCDKETANFIPSEAVSVKNNAYGTRQQGSPKSSPPTDETYAFRAVKTQKVVKIHEEPSSVNSTKNFRPIKRSPTPGRLKTRELRESDLIYFGVDSTPKNVNNDTAYIRQMSAEGSDQDEFQSVKLIQRISNSACNSETEDAPEYINIPFNTDYAPVPRPRIRSKFDDKPNQIDEIKVLKPVIEQVISNDETVTTRRSKLRRQEEMSSTINSSLSEPRKNNKYNSIEKPYQQPNHSIRCLREQTMKENLNDDNTTPTSKAAVFKARTPEDNIPIYANLNKTDESNVRKHISKIDSYSRKTTQQEDTRNKKDSTVHRSRKLETPTSSLNRSTDKFVTRKARTSRNNTDTLENKNKKNGFIQTGSSDEIQNSNHSLRNANKHLHDTKKSNEKKPENKHSHDITNKLKQEHKSRSSQRQSNKDVAKEAAIRDSSTRNKKDSLESKSAGDSESNISDTKLRKIQTSNKSTTRIENVKIIPKVEKSTIDKNTTSRDAKPRQSSKSRKSEYVINYDDKNGTVSSVRKLRSGSGSSSPRRTKTSKEVVKEKFKENLKPKTSDKAALLQPEDHQRNVNKINGDRKRKAKVHVQRSCQVL